MITINIKEPEDYTIDEIFNFFNDCCRANSKCPNSSAMYANILGNRGIEILQGTINKERVLSFYSNMDTLSYLGYDEFLTPKSKEMIANYKAYKASKNIK